jgi:YfiH family protein
MCEIPGGLYYSLPEFAADAGIWHGFGTRELTLTALEEEAGRRGMRTVFLAQKHSDTVHLLSDYPADSLTGDALVTNLSGILLVIRTADCLPVLISDSERGAQAVAHCGWRGTSLGIVQKVVRTLRDEFGSSASGMSAALGPCIASACYEVGGDVRSAFADRGHPLDVFRRTQDSSRKYQFDLREANLCQLREAGLADTNIFSISYCTHCEKNLYSYRRETHEAGRLLNFIGRWP